MLEDELIRQAKIEELNERLRIAVKQDKGHTKELSKND